MYTFLDEDRQESIFFVKLTYLFNKSKCLQRGSVNILKLVKNISSFRKKEKEKKSFGEEK